MTTSTRYLGTCGCCERIIKVQNNLLVHHGYKRPGHGSINGDCFGALRTPHELSPEVAQEYQVDCKCLILASERSLAELPGKTELRVQMYHPRLWRDDKAIIRKGDPGWELAVEQEASNLRYRIRSLQAEVERMERLLKDWTEKPLTTVEEEMAQKREAKAVRDAAKAAKTAEKLQAKVSGYQGRIDSAARRKTFTALVDIYRDAPSKLRDIDHTLDRVAALKLLDRDSVWARLGLTPETPRDTLWTLRALKDWP